MNRPLIIVILAVGIILTSAGCAKYHAAYQFGLKDTTKVDQAVERQGNTSIPFEDDVIRVRWRPTAVELFFELTNKTQTPLWIVWEEAKLIDADKKPHRIMHSGVKPFYRDKTIEPTLVAPQENLSDVIIPTDHVYYGGRRSGRWKKKPLLPESKTRFSSSSKDELTAKANEFVGKSLQLILPIQIGEKVTKYTFNFEVQGVDVN